MNHTITIAVIIFVAGLFGGVVNYYRSYTINSGSHRECMTCILIGVGASCLVPLFLSMISSNLIENSRSDDKYFFTFGGLCIIAAIFSNKFINSIGEKVLKEVEQTKEGVNDIKTHNKFKDKLTKTIEEQLKDRLDDRLTKEN